MGKKYASGGAIGGLDNINQSATELSESLDQISSGLYGDNNKSGLFGGGSAAQSDSTAFGSLKHLGLKKGGAVKKMANGGYVKAADGIAQRGKTRGKMC